MKNNLIAFILLTVFLSGCQQVKTDNTKTFHASHWARKANAPFSDAVQVNDWFFLSGQLGIDDKTRKLVSGGIVPETEKTLQNIQEILKHHGMTMNNVVKCLVILSDIDDFSAFNEVYKKYLPQKPARTTFAAGGLAINAKIEIECMAHK